ncbi:hypothetical protein R3P38DRAFT_3204429 [Favolaschia claudopus]|uniref:Uncharacterized protein n=1 Tax=Favolaschia claudopus TaxID=2862362 RepID=A0AAW0APG4_9AGAR
MSERREEEDVPSTITFAFVDETIMALLAASLVSCTFDRLALVQARDPQPSHLRFVIPRISIPSRPAPPAGY